MKIPQIRDPNLPPLEELPESYHAKVSPLLCFPSVFSFSSRSSLASLSSKFVCPCVVVCYACRLHCLDVVQHPSAVRHS